MFGMLLSSQEQKELQYLIKKEMDEILFDLEDERISHVVKRSMEERYKILFSMLQRVAPKNEYIAYLRSKKYK
ncbi:hypothetical protein SAMN05877753_1142 [Bacillus oleivorans]|uniref:Uncharacterized protein n=1 Tax=Bacillus oleivorans TaxID=1448271 RepID=A0A285D710_9BACI|nr:hypothetical protein [Bacillus oleivorans]SNX75592.1 hypothetical protein SAMN05877753_1142 [Bacillus oleivorans]